MHRSDSAGFLRQCNDLGELHMVEIRIGNLVQNQNEISVIFELGDHVHSSMYFYFPDRSDIFQNDNARIHRPRVVQDWCRDKEGSFSHMEWPS